MISLIVAYAKNRVIGRNHKIPWNLPNDLQYFKKVTTGHPIVMGRKTFQSIGRALPNRRNLVLTRQPDFQASGVEVVHHRKEILSIDGDLFIIGGAEIYSQFLDEVDRLYITEVDLEPEGDAFFPEWNPADFRLISRQEGVLDERNQVPHTFLVYDRIKKK